MGMHVDKSGEDIATGRIDGLDLSVGVFDTFFIGSHLWPFALLARHSYLPYLSLFDKEISCAVNALRRIDDAAALQQELAAPDIYSASAKDRLKQLLAQQAELARETERVETAWLEASEELEEQTRQLG